MNGRFAGMELSDTMQKNKFVKWFVRILVLANISAGCAGLSRADDATNRFGFTGPEIFPIDSQISLLRSADLNGDGLNDLIVVNNSRSKIDLLYNQTGSTNLNKPSPR